MILPADPAIAHCGCCGKTASEVMAGATILASIWSVRRNEQGHVIEWRCDQHRGRLPCVAPGCGRTYKMEEGDTYAVQILCGKHWRLAPLRLRRMAAHLRRLGNRLAVDGDWPTDIAERHHTVWNRCLREITRKLEGGIDIAEIERMLG